MTTKLQNDKVVPSKTEGSVSLIESGVERIEEIKKNICSKTPQTCKAEVYEMWNGIFEPEEDNQ